MEFSQHKLLKGDLMSFVDIFTWVVLLIIITTVVGIIAFLGLWLGKVAQQRNHPQAEAIQIGSWVTLLFGFVLWPLVLIWAYTRPANIQVSSRNTMDESEEMNQKFIALETRIAQLESTRRGEQ